MNSKNILITGAWQGAKDHINDIEAMGHTVHFLQLEKDPLPCDPSDIDVIIGNGIFLTHPIEKFTRLTYIQITSAGYDRVPMDYVGEHGITIHNARGVYSAPMAEYALAGVLSLYKQMSFFRENQKKHLWEKHRNLLELTDKRILIIGCGSIGSECAKRFAAFDCRVIGVTPHPHEDVNYEKIYGLDAMDEQISLADIILLTLPMTVDSHHLFDEKRLSLMKDTSILINLSRGAIVDQSALEETLIQGKIYGAILDVFEEEPLSADSRLWDMENVIVTPHNSFVGEKNRERMDKVVMGNLRGLK